MATNNIAWAACKHMQADATLIALVPAARILIDPPATTALPYIAVVASGGSDDVHEIARHRLSFLVYAGTAEACANVQARMRVLFHEKTNYSLGSGLVVAACTISRRLGAPDIERGDAQSAWSSQAFYEFQIRDSY